MLQSIISMCLSAFRFVSINEILDAQTENLSQHKIQLYLRYLYRRYYPSLNILYNISAVKLWTNTAESNVFGFFFKKLINNNNKKYTLLTM